MDGREMDEREDRIRERARQLWEEEGRPDGRAADHWFQAKEIVALEEGRPDAFKPVDAAEAPPEPIEALVNTGEFPTLTDQGEMEVPHRPGSDPEGINSGPVSEIETVRRTLEVPAKRRGRRAPAGDSTGAMSGRREG